MLRKTFLYSAFATLAFLSANVQAGSIIDVSIVIPDEEVLIDFNSTGLDWVYAGPVAPNERGLGQIEGPGYRAAEGWRHATAAEWALRPDWTDFTKPGQATPSPFAGHSNHSVYRFTSEYWSTYRHVDLNDANQGRLTNGLDIGSLTGVYETWYVRDSRNPQVPEPGSFAVFAILGVAGIATRRRRRA